MPKINFYNESQWLPILQIFVKDIGLIRYSNDLSGLVKIYKNKVTGDFVVYRGAVGVDGVDGVDGVERYPSRWVIMYQYFNQDNV